MIKITKYLCNPFICSLMVIVAIIEFILLFRHNVVRDALIERGFIKQIPQDRSDYRCIKSWENTLAKLNYKADICFFGNSITLQSDFQKHYPDKRIVNLGYSADRLNGMALRCGQIAAVQPDQVFIMAGINDVLQKNVTVDDFAMLYEDMLDSIQKAAPQAQLYLQSILPVNHTMKTCMISGKKIIEANERIKIIAKQRDWEYVDLYTLYVDDGDNLQVQYTYDGLHLTSDAYNLWYYAISKYIK